MEQNEKELEAIRKELSSILAEKNPLELLQRNLQMTLNVQKGLINQYIEKFITVCNQEQLKSIDIKQKLERLSETQKALIEREKSIDELLESEENKTLIGILENDTLSHLLYQLQNGLVTANFLAFGLIAGDYKKIKLNEQMVLPDINEFKVFLNDFLSPFKEKYNNYEMVIKLLNCFENAIIEIYAEKTTNALKKNEDIFTLQPLGRNTFYTHDTSKFIKSIVNKKNLENIINIKEENTIISKTDSEVNKKTDSHIYVTITTNKSLLNKIVKMPLSAIDINICNAINGVYTKKKDKYGENAVITFTVKEILSECFGEEKTNFSTATQKEVEQIIEKLRHTYIEFTNENLPKFTIENINEAIKTDAYDDLALYAPRRTLTTVKGNKIRGYYLPFRPFLSQISNNLNQNIKINKVWLNYSDKTNLSLTNTTYAVYLLEQIDFMKKDKQRQKGKQKHRNNVILFETIYKALSMPTPEERAEASTVKDKATAIRKYAKQDRDNICKILDSFTETKDNGKSLIKGYKEKKENGKIIGVTIFLND